jgi:hypothetical protein
MEAPLPSPQHTMPITSALMLVPSPEKGGDAGTSNVICLRHDIVECEPRGCFILHEWLARHRRGRRAQGELQLSKMEGGGVPRYPYPPPQKPTRGRVNIYQIRTRSACRCSKENGLTLKSTVGQGITSFATATASIVIENSETKR